MKKVIIVLFLLSNLLLAHSIEEQIDEELKLQIERLEGAINHSEKVGDPQVKEKFKERLETMKSELLQKSSNYSKEPMNRILELALHNTPIDRLSEIITVHEIDHRSEEFKESVENLLKKEDLQVEELTNLPYWAQYISDDYQVDVAKQILFHPSTKKLGDNFLMIPSFKSYFDSDPEVLKETLNKLIEQGRIVKGGKIYNWWIEETADEMPLESINAQPNAKQREGVANKDTVSEERKLFPWLIIGLVLLVTMVFFKLQGKSKR